MSTTIPPENDPKPPYTIPPYTGPTQPMLPPGITPTTLPLLHELLGHTPEIPSRTAIREDYLRYVDTVEAEILAAEEYTPGGSRERYHLARAQVYATLAQAAATFSTGPGLRF